MGLIPRSEKPLPETISAGAFFVLSRRFPSLDTCQMELCRL